MLDIDIVEAVFLWTLTYSSRSGVNIFAVGSPALIDDDSGKGQNSGSSSQVVHM